jgi:hypothetical protein
VVAEGVEPVGARREIENVLVIVEMAGIMSRISRGVESMAELFDNSNAPLALPLDDASCAVCPLPCDRTKPRFSKVKSPSLVSKAAELID